MKVLHILLTITVATYLFISSVETIYSIVEKKEVLKMLEYQSKNCEPMG